VILDHLPIAPAEPRDETFAVGVACVLALAAIRSFDWPCGCGHTSDACTKKADGTCDG